MNAGSPWAADGDQDVEHQCFSAQAERHKINQDGHANSLGGKFHLATGNAKNLEPDRPHLRVSSTDCRPIVGTKNWGIGGLHASETSDVTVL